MRIIKTATLPAAARREAISQITNLLTTEFTNSKIYTQIYPSQNKRQSIVPWLQSVRLRLCLPDSYIVVDEGYQESRPRETLRVLGHAVVTNYSRGGGKMKEPGLWDAIKCG
ncbi:UNVERIFIED_CONTAM: hypothetical protein HDU68_001143, partial [Siphonaria sp. JEL0065]